VSTLEEIEESVERAFLCSAHSQALLDLIANIREYRAKYESDLERTDARREDWERRFEAERRHVSFLNAERVALQREHDAMRARVVELGVFVASVLRTDPKDETVVDKLVAKATAKGKPMKCECPVEGHVPGCPRDRLSALDSKDAVVQVDATELYAFGLHLTSFSDAAEAATTGAKLAHRIYEYARCTRVAALEEAAKECDAWWNAHAELSLDKRASFGIGVANDCAHLIRNLKGNPA
jgi:hypothetical protein